MSEQPTSTEQLSSYEQSRKLAESVYVQVATPETDLALAQVYATLSVTEAVEKLRLDQAEARKKPPAVKRSPAQPREPKNTPQLATSRAAAQRENLKTLEQPSE